MIIVTSFSNHFNHTNHKNQSSDILGIANPCLKRDGLQNRHDACIFISGTTGYKPLLFIRHKLEKKLAPAPPELHTCVSRKKI
jgi:hypothetical protein